MPPRKKTSTATKKADPAAAQKAATVKAASAAKRGARATPAPLTVPPAPCPSHTQGHQTPIRARGRAHARGGGKDPPRLQHRQERRERQPEPKADAARCVPGDLPAAGCQGH